MDIVRKFDCVAKFLRFVCFNESLHFELYALEMLRCTESSIHQTERSQPINLMAFNRNHC